MEIISDRVKKNINNVDTLLIVWLNINALIINLANTLYIPMFIILVIQFIFSCIIFINKVCNNYAFVIKCLSIICRPEFCIIYNIILFICFINSDITTNVNIYIINIYMTNAILRVICSIMENDDQILRSN